LKLPITIIAAKLMLPVYEPIYQFQYRLLAPVVGDMAATAIASVNTWLSPDLFGFLFWELKENWRLYRANRSPLLKPVTVGQHGETVLQLLRPGIHSGTMPQLFDKLRRAERVAIATGQWRTARAYRQRLHEVEEAVRRFLERDFLVLLWQSRSWKDQPLRAGKIELATRLIRIDLEHDGHPQHPLRLCLLEKTGWLVAYIEQPGWLTALAEPQLGALTTALVGLYKFAGVDLVREEVEAGLAGTGGDYEIRSEGLVLRSQLESEDKMVCSMHDTTRLMPGQALHLQPDHAAVPPPERLVFARQPVRWQRWVEAWQEEQKGVIPHLLPIGTVILPRELRPEPPAAAEEQHRPPATVLPQTFHAGGNGPAAVRDQV
jgi:hypothetical protein